MLTVCDARLLLVHASYGLIIIYTTGFARHRALPNLALITPPFSILLVLFPPFHFPPAAQRILLR